MDKKIKLLDCTLRDGGYVNDWNFGYSTIICMFERLVSAGIDLIEIGFLDDRHPFDKNRTIQPTTKCYDEIFSGCDKGNSTVMAMIDYGTCSLENIGLCEESFIDGIRVIFKKPKMYQAVEFGRKLMEKGYQVSLQMVSITSYSDRDLLDLIDQINEVRPYAISMVDTYGLMHKEEMLHYFHILDRNLLPSITIGYHSHNNFQLGYSNEVEMIQRSTARTLLVDGTVYGMGKSAGNAPLELLAQYLNENYNAHYDIDQILEIIDVNIMRIYREHYWGYSLLFFLSASNDCHPNYINYLLSKHTLSIKAINDIAREISSQKKLDYDQSYIESLYQQYQRKVEFESDTIRQLKMELTGKSLLLLGPGKSLDTKRDQIHAYIEEKNPIVISVNCIPLDYRLDYVFIGNSKRYNMLFQFFKELRDNTKIIATSNISSVKRPFDYIFNYSSLRDDNCIIEDNAFIMMLKALLLLEIDNVTLAGFDGFSEQTIENYYDEYMDFSTDYDKLKLINETVQKSVQEFRPKLKIDFLTESCYEK